MRDLFVSYCDARHGYCVYEQTSRGFYVIVAGPYIDPEDAREEAKRLENE